METNPELPISETQQVESEETTPQIEIDEIKLNEYQAKLKFEQNLPFAILAGIGSALIGATIWAVITVLTKYQIGYMAVGVGLLVGFSVRFAGNGIDQIFGILGGLFAFLGCLVGNFFSLVGFVAAEYNVSYFDVFSFLPLNELPSIMYNAANPMDILFYGLAIYEGYKFAFRVVTDEEILQNAGKVKSL